VPDSDPANPPVEPAGVDEAAAPPPARKASARKATKRPARQAAKRAAKRAAREAASERVKVGSDTIVMPKSLATNLTSKDLKRLRAVFKRVHKRGKKRAAKKRATKKKG
jgi:hypothetical protein